MGRAADGHAPTRLRGRLVYAGLYFAEGAPIGFIWWALPVWLRGAGWTPGEISRLVAWATWPWALKFLWAPVVDLIRTPRFGLRGWILASQSGMALTLAPLLFLDLGADADVLLAVLLSHAVAAATQDAAIDTLAVHGVAEAERGSVNGWMQVGMLGGRSLFGGGAILLAGWIGYAGVVGTLIVAIALPGLLAIAFAREPARPLLPRRERVALFRDSVRRMAGRREVWAGLFLAATVGAGFEGLASLAGPLLVDRGVGEDAVGLFFLVPAVVLMAGGALLGGRASDRFGRRRVTALCQGAAALVVLAVGATVWWVPVGSGQALLVLLLALLYLAAGGAVASLYGLLMDLADPAAAATQFCMFMGAINLCMVWSTGLLGAMIERLGYGPAIAIGGVVSLVVLPVLALTRPPRRRKNG